MFAYVLLLLAVVSRVVPHPAWFSFTAVGGSLLYFGARRSWWQGIFPIAALAATDYYLTVYAYNYPFHVQDYLVTWAWYGVAHGNWRSSSAAEGYGGPRHRCIHRLVDILFPDQQLHRLAGLCHVPADRWRLRRLLPGWSAVLPQ